MCSKGKSAISPRTQVAYGDPGITRTGSKSHAGSGVEGWGTLQASDEALIECCNAGQSSSCEGHRLPERYTASTAPCYQGVV